MSLITRLLGIFSFAFYSYLVKQQWKMIHYTWTWSKAVLVIKYLSIMPWRRMGNFGRPMATSFFNSPLDGNEKSVSRLVRFTPGERAKTRLLVNVKEISWQDPRQTQVKEDEMGRACSTNGATRNAYRILVGKPEGRRPLGRPRCRWVDDIKIDLR
jgi:hypothetical protein